MRFLRRRRREPRSYPGQFGIDSRPRWRDEITAIPPPYPIPGGCDVMIDPSTIVANPPGTPIEAPPAMRPDSPAAPRPMRGQMKPEEEQAIEFALRQNEPTTPEGWLEWEKEFGGPILRSGVWPPTPVSNGHWRWELRHPASGRKAQGVEHHVTDCYVTMDRVAQSWFPEAEGSEKMTIARLQP